MPVPDEWYTGLGSNLGLTNSPTQLSFWRAWGTLENVNPAYNNPFGILGPDGKPARYATPAMGQAATADLLQRKYPRIVKDLSQDRADVAIATLTQSAWNGAGHYGARRGDAVRGYVIDVSQSSVYKTWVRQGGPAVQTAAGRPVANPKPSGPLDALHSLEKLGSTLSSGDFWRRALLGVGGVALIAVGLSVSLGVGPLGGGVKVAKLVQGLTKGGTA